MMNPGRHRMRNPRTNGMKPEFRSAAFHGPLGPDQLARPAVGGNGATDHQVDNGLVGNGAGNGSAAHAPTTTAPRSRVTRTETRPRGTTLIRFGMREIGAGMADVAAGRLEVVRRHLPRRARTISYRRLAVVLVVVLALVVGVVAVAGSTLLDSLKGPTNVVVAPTRAAVINSTPGGVGSIAAAPQDVATVSLNVSVQGVTAPIEVTAVDVLANQQVAAGAPLVQMNPIPFEQNLAQVKLTLEQAEATLQSAQAAAAVGGAAAAAQGYLAVQIPTLQGQVGLDQQLVQIAEGNATAITSPIAGYVSQVKVVAGQVVSAGNTLIQVVNPSEIIVNAGMQLTDLQTISVGDAAAITPSQLPNVHLHGTVVAVSASATGDGLEGTVVIEAPNLTTHPVPIGTQSIVNVSAPLRAAVSVPTLAVLNVEIAPVVGVISHGRIHFQPVEIGASDGTRTQILSGLHAGQQVAVSNMQMLTDGDKVRESSGGT
jgi:RND family efflux transporter MFP subunit